MRKLISFFFILFTTQGCGFDREEPNFDIDRTCKSIESSVLLTKYRYFSIITQRNNNIAIDNPIDSCKYEYINRLDGKDNRYILFKGKTDKKMEKYNLELIFTCKNLNIISFGYWDKFDCTIFSTNTYVKSKYDQKSEKNSYKYSLVYFYKQPDSVNIKILESIMNRSNKFEKLDDHWYFYTTNAYWKYKNVTTMHSWFYLLFYH